MTTKTITKPNALLNITAEEIQQQFNFKSVRVVNSVVSTTIITELSKIDCYKLYDLNNKVVSSINYSSAEVKTINNAFSKLYAHSNSNKYSINAHICYFKASENSDNKGITTISLTYTNPLAINQNDNASNSDNKEAKVAAEKKAFIKSAKTADLLGLINSFSVNSTQYDDDKELTRLFIIPNINSNYTAEILKNVDFVKLLTDDYSTESDEKKVIQKLLQSFVVTYKNAKKDIDTALKHSNVQICVKTDDKHYIVLKKFNLLIFNIVKINSLNALHDALEQNLFNGIPANTEITKIIEEINEKIPYSITDFREFKKFLYRMIGKSTKSHIVYNKANVENFISSYVIARYNKRIKQYISILKASK